MKKFLVIVIVTAAVYVACSPKSVKAGDRPLLVAHRGGPQIADENTLKAYSLAAEYGMDYIECDPRFTKDGVLIISHDKSVDRVTKGKGNVEDMTLAEIKKLKTKNGESVPTFEEVVKLAKEKNLKIYIDSKLNDTSYFQKIIKILKDNGMEKNVVFGIWWDSVQKTMEKEHPEIATSLSYPAPFPTLKAVKKSGSEWVGMMVDTATEGRIAQSDKMGLKVITMPINDEETIREKIKFGLHVIQTDNPPLLKKIVDEIFGEKENSDG